MRPCPVLTISNGFVVNKQKKKSKRNRNCIYIYYAESEFVVQNNDTDRKKNLTRLEDNRIPWHSCLFIGKTASKIECLLFGVNVANFHIILTIIYLLMICTLWIWDGCCQFVINTTKSKITHKVRLLLLLLFERNRKKSDTVQEVCIYMTMTVIHMHTRFSLSHTDTLLTQTRTTIERREWARKKKRRKKKIRIRPEIYEK